jgi:hypothetical protein
MSTKLVSTVLAMGHVLAVWQRRLRNGVGFHLVLGNWVCRVTIHKCIRKDPLHDFMMCTHGTANGEKSDEKLSTKKGS